VHYNRIEKEFEKSRRSRDFSTFEILFWYLLTVGISHNVFRTIAYTKKKWLRNNFFDRNILLDINVINDLPQ
jgi:hypothetical protein